MTDRPGCGAAGWPARPGLIAAGWLTGLALLLGLAAPAVAGDPGPPIVTTNQAYIEEVTRPSGLDIGDLKAVFAHVLASLPDRVQVYPTENYYYFRFHHDGVPYAGNIRLDASDRGAGLVNFAYFPAPSGWRQDEFDTYAALGAKDGVTVTKVDRLSYTVSHAGKTVRFDLNDLTGVAPPPGVLADDERYLGPIFDESAIRFFLVFNTRLNTFHYILDETVPVPDELFTSRVSERIVIGRRTGFAFFSDHHRPRRILIGVYEENAVANTWFDGPFDQLPDNFLVGDELKDAIVAGGLARRDEIDRFGILPGGNDRVLIKPYITYAYQDDLQVFSDCAEDPTLAAAYYYECFVVDPAPVEAEDDDGAAPVPSPAAPADAEGERQGSLAPAVPAAGKPRVDTNQRYVEEVMASPTAPLGSMADVFAMVLERLPSPARVYTTENYYYFHFHHGSIEYAGNIRLGASDRDQGLVHFTYYPTYTGWRRDPIDTYQLFSAADGVAVERVGHLRYRVSHRGRAVEFHLNDLADAKPGPDAVSPDETFIGPVFDESAMRFHLVYNRRLKVFHYILDETARVPDRLEPSAVSPRIVVGRRTGYAFYRDKNRDRRILIGVYEENSNVNNQLDGPFDQLPDNFIEGDTLREALIDHTPELDGQIDRYGLWPDGDQRYLIGPYLYYRHLGQLAMFDDCATAPEMSGEYYYRCFVVEEPEEN